jgi:glycosyltransferase involved in cell wall biosynthesis
VLKVLFIEPYYGGSHAAFADGYRAHSRHSVELLTMPARKWKWRMRGAALSVADVLASYEADVMLVSDYLDLACLTGLLPARLAGIPRVVYFHENQLTHPLSPDDERDYQYGFTNVTTCLSADRVVFNSAFHRDSFIDAVGALLGRMPDCVPEGVPQRIRERSVVIPVGVDLDSVDAVRAAARPRDGPLRILWNHRWEFDKGPEAFFDVMRRLDAEGADFGLAVAGKSFRACPEVFERMRVELARHLRAFGYIESRGEYLRLLCESDVVVSTAIHEFFGIAVVEAVYAGCAPLLPNRLSYPELLPPECHSAHLYATERELLERLRRWIERPDDVRAVNLRRHMERFSWRRVAPQLDDLLEELKGAADA